MPNVADIERAFHAAFPDAPAPATTVLYSPAVLLGDHLGGCGLPQLAAPAGAVNIVFAPRTDTTVSITANGFPVAPFSLDNVRKPPKQQGDQWTEAARCALAALNAEVGLAGMDLHIATEWPLQAHLNARETFCVACAVAYAGASNAALGAGLSRADLAALLGEAVAVCDSLPFFNASASLFGTPGQFVKADAEPARGEMLPFPLNLAVVLTPPLQPSGFETSVASLAGVFEMLRALVERQVQEEFDPEIELNTLGELWTGPLCLTHSEASGIIENAFPQPTLSFEQIAQHIGQPTGTVAAALTGLACVTEGAFPAQALGRHVLAELQAVESARERLLAGDGAGLADLLNASHERCNALFGGASGDVTALRAAARDAGALATRVASPESVGIHLVPLDRQAAFVAAMKALPAYRVHDIPFPVITGEGAASIAL